MIKLQTLSLRKAVYFQVELSIKRYCVVFRFKYISKTSLRWWLQFYDESFSRRNIKLINMCKSQLKIENESDCYLLNYFKLDVYLYLFQAQLSTKSDVCILKTVVKRIACRGWCTSKCAKMKGKKSRAFMKSKLLIFTALWNDRNQKLEDSSTMYIHLAIGVADVSCLAVSVTDIYLVPTWDPNNVNRTINPAPT